MIMTITILIIIINIINIMKSTLCSNVVATFLYGYRTGERFLSVALEVSSFVLAVVDHSSYCHPKPVHTNTTTHSPLAVKR